MTHIYRSAFIQTKIFLEQMLMAKLSGNVRNLFLFLTIRNTVKVTKTIFVFIKNDIM